MLNEPNTFSPANVDASVMFRKWRDSKGKDKEYAEIVRKQVSATKAEAEEDGDGYFSPLHPPVDGPLEWRAALKLSGLSC